MTNDFKAKARKEMLSIRRNLDENTKKNYNTLLKNHLCSWIGYRHAKVIMVYLSMQDEPQTDEFIADALANEKIVCVPHTLSKYGLMEAVELRNLNHLVIGRLKIREPNPNEIIVVEPKTIDLIIVPGVVFDLSGNRIGMGAGYYDRFLLQAPQAIRLGLAWHFQVKPEIMTQSHDIKMHYLLTETGIFHCNKGKM
jgi:5-formyltetrahydrofolate cyclo-ligase